MSKDETWRGSWVMNEYEGKERISVRITELTRVYWLTFD